MPRYNATFTQRLYNGDKRRHHLNNVSVLPLPIRKKYDAINSDCHICLSPLEKYDITFLRCFGKDSCRHGFCNKCIIQWLQKGNSRTCPLCRADGGIIGRLRTVKCRETVIVEALQYRIPPLFVLKGFFEMAKFRINKITFVQLNTEDEDEESAQREKEDKHMVEFFCCFDSNCTSSRCTHMLGSVIDALIWIQGLPKDMKFYTLKKLARHLIPSLRKRATHVWEHLVKHVNDESYHICFNYEWEK